MTYSGSPELVEPSGHTPQGGVLVGSDSARRRLVVFEDLQCPFCRQFEEVSGDLLRRETAAGAVAVEYRIRSFLGPESVRAANALAAAAEEGGFDQLRRELFASQPAEHSGGYTSVELIAAGRRAGISSGEYTTAVRDGRFEPWVQRNEARFRAEDPTGTPAAVLDGVQIGSRVLLDPPALGEAIRR
jgi:protein-disulfide isomerase